MNLRHFAFLRPLLLPLALLTLAGSALALNSPDEEVTVRKLTAEEILEITIDKTWVIDFDNVAMTSTTFYKAGGERFTERQGLVERMLWFVNETENSRCAAQGFDPAPRGREARRHQDGAQGHPGRGAVRDRGGCH